ncbi:MAG: hypothetical protein ABSE77_20630 [Acidimicrobiales bacterium]|jgi:hypothetical protein
MGDQLGAAAREFLAWACDDYTEAFVLRGIVQRLDGPLSVDEERTSAVRTLDSLLRSESHHRCWAEDRTRSPLGRSPAPDLATALDRLRHGQAPGRCTGAVAQLARNRVSDARHGSPWSPSMTTVTCPSCGFSFETTATTNTRCRRCRKVVNIGSTRPRRSAKLPQCPSEGAGDAEPTEDEDEPRERWVAVALVAAAAVALAIFLGRRPPS